MLCWPTSLPTRQTIRTEEFADLYHRAGTIVSEVADHDVSLVDEDPRSTAHRANVDARVHVAVKLRTTDDDLREHRRTTLVESRICGEKGSDAIGRRGDLLDHRFELLDGLTRLSHDVLALSQLGLQVEQLRANRITWRKLSGETFHSFDEPQFLRRLVGWQRIV
jgi:hypothetical protein